MDEDLLRALEAEDREREATERARERRRQRWAFGAVAAVAVVGFGVGLVWTFAEASQEARMIALIGREGGRVRVEVEGRAPIVLPRRGGQLFRPPEPGPRRFRFVDEETGAAFERVLDVPRVDGAFDETTLAVPTEENVCFVMLDVDAWYGEALGLLEAAVERASHRAEEVELPRPRVVARIRPLDALPHDGYLRGLDLPSTIAEDRRALTLVEARCDALSLPDDVLVDTLLERHLESARDHRHARLSGSR